MRKYAIIFAFLILSSCEQKEVIPEYVIAKDEFAAILTEVQLAESLVRLGYHRFPDSLYRNDSIYNSVFRDLEISQAVFDSNMNYYLDKPDEFSEIYDLVLTELSKRTSKIDANKKILLEDPVIKE